MGSQDKALILLNGQPLIDRAVVRLSPQVAEVALSANGGPARFGHPQLTVLPDAAQGQGPLAGILAGLQHAVARGAAYMATVAVDTPFFPDDLVSRLATSATATRVAIAHSLSGRHPTFALWPVAALAVIADALAQGQFRLEDAACAVGMAEVHFPETTPDPFFNINTPDDLAQAETFAR